MSWDFSMSRSFTVKDGLNYTYNVSSMYYDEDVFGESGIAKLDGMSGKEAISVITKALNGLHSDPNKFRAMNPENGWGSYKGALKVVCELLDWCIDEPNATIRVY